jgi:ABC-type amino acid transport substrate-binding protein
MSMARSIALLGVVAETASEPVLLKMGQDVNYPPYAFEDDAGELAGFGIDVARGVEQVCEETLKFEFVKILWSDCWVSEGGGNLGGKLADGTLDACMTYTHTQGRRPEVADFSYGILKVNKPAGLLTLLDEAGCPKLSGTDDLYGKTVVDVGGWAPTADTIDDVENKCTKQGYSTDHTMITGDGNDESMKLLRDGIADAMFVYADQAANYQCGPGVTATWDCELWKGFGTDYAYVQTGQYGHMINGTTLAIAKKGSIAPEIINPCLATYMKTEDYYNVCVKHNVAHSCIRNEYFPEETDEERKAHEVETWEQEGGCDNGYCPCEVCSKAPETSSPVFLVLLYCFFSRF